MITQEAPLTRREQKERTRASLLAAAEELIRARGLDGVTARDISDRAGVAAGTFFVHFPEVASLVDALFDEHVGRSLARGYRTVADDASLVDSVVHVADALFAGYAKEPDLARAFITNTLFRVDDAGATSARLADFRAWVLDRMVRARASGELSAEIDLEAAFETFFCLYLGLVVGGLRGSMSRRRQRDLLRSALEALLVVAS